MVSYSQHNISQDDIDAIVEVMRSKSLTQGQKLPEFEEALARKTNAKYSVAVNSATSALHLSCISLGLGPNDILWTCPISFVASSNCGLYCGAKVDFVDIDILTGLMSISNLESKLEDASKKGTLPKILIPVHLAGSSCDMRRIKELSLKYGFKIIEDASHAVGAKYLDEPVGNCKYSDITVFSFHPVKIITTGEGGMALTNNKYLADQISKLRGHGIVREGFNHKSPGPWYYEQQQLGFNYRITDIQAALGLSQLKKLDLFVQERRKQINIYRKIINEIDEISLLLEPVGVYSSFHLAIIRLNNANPFQHRSLFEWMRKNDIWVQLHYWPIHLQPYYKKLGFIEGQFPNSELYANSAFSIPLFPYLKESTQKKVVELLKEGISKII